LNAGLARGECGCGFKDATESTILRRKAMDEDGRKAFRVGLNRWGGIAVAIWGGSEFLWPLLILLRADSHLRKMLGEPYAVHVIAPFASGMAVGAAMLVIGVLLWREGQREAAKRLPAAAFRYTFLKVWGAALLALALLWLLGHVWMRGFMGADMEARVWLWYGMIQASGIVAAALFVAGGAYRAAWACAGLGGRRRTGILEGALGVCAGVVLLIVGSRWDLSSIFILRPAVTLLGGIVALRSVSDALLLFHKRPAPD
jgi:hypothetical protein